MVSVTLSEAPRHGSYCHMDAILSLRLQSKHSTNFNISHHSHQTSWYNNEEIRFLHFVLHDA